MKIWMKYASDKGWQERSDLSSDDEVSFLTAACLINEAVNAEDVGKFDV